MPSPPPTLFPLLRHANSFAISWLLLLFLNERPCLYCSILLLILFVSSCYWSDHCLFRFFDDFNAFFEPQYASGSSQCSSGPPSPAEARDGSLLMAALNDTTVALGSAALGELKRRVPSKSEWTSIGIHWIRSWLGTREWRVPCVDIKIRL